MVVEAVVHSAFIVFLFVACSIADSGENLPESCDANKSCTELPAVCIMCAYNASLCKYSSVPINVSCFVIEGRVCYGDRQFQRSVYCKYCYQLDAALVDCDEPSGCSSVSSGPSKTVNCTAKLDVVCLGSRNFSKNVPCRWTSGYRWSTAMILSVTLGGFGVDRFYLGMWKEGMGKLFSFGAAGIWTIVDIILVATGYIGPADGSQYIG